MDYSQMDYKQIEKANSEIKMLNLKGKNYAMVPERINAFRKLFPTGFINTEIVSHDGTVVLMQSKAGYYDSDGHPVILGTGYAQEVRGKGLVNGTSYIENCETSAVGRALGMIALGIDGGGVCSAEELVNAITAQNQMNNEGQRVQPKAEVTTRQTVPEQPKLSPEMQFLNNELAFIAKAQNMEMASVKAAFSVTKKVAIKQKLVPDCDVKDYNMDQIKTILDQMRKNMGNAA